MKFQGPPVGIELDWSKLNAGAPLEVPSGKRSEAEAKDERLGKFFIINYSEKGLYHHDVPFNFVTILLEADEDAFADVARMGQLSIAMLDFGKSRQSSV